MCWGGISVLIYQPHVPMSIRQLSTYMLYMCNTVLLMGRVEMWWGGPYAPNQEKPHTTPLHSLIYSIYISVGGTTVLIYQPHVPMYIRQLSTDMLYMYNNTVLLMGRVEMWWGGTSVLIYQPHVPMSIRLLSTYTLYV